MKYTIEYNKWYLCHTEIPKLTVIAKYKPKICVYFQHNKFGMLFAKYVKNEPDSEYFIKNELFDIDVINKKVVNTNNAEQIFEIKLTPTNLNFFKALLDMLKGQDMQRPAFDMLIKSEYFVKQIK